MNVNQGVIPSVSGCAGRLKVADLRLHVRQRLEGFQELSN
jgi:hypothetical protein